jgi:putative ABC transport system substrate-binding protein
MREKFTGLALGAMLFALGASAQGQQPGKVVRIGFLDNSTASGSTALVKVFHEELSRLGWIDGKNTAIEYRFGESKGPAHMRELAADLVRLKVDLIVVTGTAATLAAKNSTTSIPIVMTSPADPVGQGLVANLARPGGNVTGLSSLGTELHTKRLEILKDAVTKLARVGLLRLPGARVQELQLKELRATAPALKLKLEEIETQNDAKGFESAFQVAKDKQVGAVLTMANRAFFAERRRIGELDGRRIDHKLPETNRCDGSETSASRDLRFQHRGRKRRLDVLRARRNRTIPAPGYHG